MAVLFFNIKSKEVVSADSEPKIAAYYNSSDLGPNAREGQDYGWRLHPEIVVQMKGIKQDPRSLESIAIRYSVPMNEIDDKLVLAYVSEMREGTQIKDNTLEDFEDEYRAEIMRLEAASHKAKQQSACTLYHLVIV